MASTRWGFVFMMLGLLLLLLFFCVVHSLYVSFLSGLIRNFRPEMEARIRQFQAKKKVEARQ